MEHTCPYLSETGKWVIGYVTRLGQGYLLFEATMHAIGWRLGEASGVDDMRIVDRATGAVVLATDPLGEGLGDDAGDPGLGDPYDDRRGKLTAIDANSGELSTGGASLTALRSRARP